MRLTRVPALLLGGALALTACGTTVDVAGRQTDSSTGGLGTTTGAVGTTGGTGLGGSGATGVIPGPGSTTGGAVIRPGSGTGSSGGAATPGAGGQVGPPGSATTTPLQIGVLVVDTDTFKKASGVGDSYTVHTRDSLHALIKGINARGGVGGRKLTVVDATMNYTASSYDAEFEAACQRFTVDNKVGAVLYDGIVYNKTFNTCLHKAGVPSFNMGLLGSSLGDSADLASFPGIVAPNAVTIDRRLKSILNKALSSGFLRAGSKLGVILETCPYNQRAYDRVVTPITTRAKVTVLRTDIDCGDGSSDHATGINRVGSAVLRYRTEGVDSIMFVTLYENGTVYYFAHAAQAQGWAPQYLLFSPQADPLRMSAYPREQLVRMRGFGGFPLYDVTTPPAPGAAQAKVRQTCLALMRRHGVVATDYAARYIEYDACDAVNLLERALTLSGGRGGTRSLVPAVEGIGTGFVSTMTYNGVTRLGAGRHDGLDLTAVSVFYEDCSCFRYATRFTPIT